MMETVLGQGRWGPLAWHLWIRLCSGHPLGAKVLGVGQESDGRNGSPSLQSRHPGRKQQDDNVAGPWRTHRNPEGPACQADRGCPGLVPNPLTPAQPWGLGDSGTQ